MITRTGSSLHHGLVWSSISSVVLKLGSFGTGILLARLLAPAEFGVYAVALAVQAVLMTVADLGLSADLIRSRDHERKAGTVGTLGLASGALLTLIMAVTAKGTATFLGAPEATGVIVVLSFTLLLGGAGVVPYATLQRNFEQKKLFTVACADFVVGTAITVALVLFGWGAMSLAVGRLVAQCGTLTLQFVMARERPRLGFDKVMAPVILAYGLPVAGANMLSWALLNADNVIISRMAGPIALGFYYLAFNIANWPMGALGQIIRSVALPAFARVSAPARDTSVAVASGPVWTISLLIGLMLALLARPVIVLVYGERWATAAVVLAYLGGFGALRALFDLWAGYLLARGRARITLAVQVLWIVALLPALAVLVHSHSIAGAGLAHLAVALLVILPAYLAALHFSGASIPAMAGALWPPIAAAAPSTLAVLAVLTFTHHTLVHLLVGGTVGSLVYAVCIAKWFQRQLTRTSVMARSLPTPADTDVTSAQPIHPTLKTPSVVEETMP